MRKASRTPAKRRSSLDEAVESPVPKRQSPLRPAVQTWPATLTFGEKDDALTSIKFQSMVMKAFEFLDQRITETAAVHNKQMKTINSKLVEALKPPFVYGGIVKEQFHQAWKTHVALLYNKALDAVVSVELDHSDPNRMWPAGDADPEKAAWPVARIPIHSLFHRYSDSVSVFIDASAVVSSPCQGGGTGSGGIRQSAPSHLFW